MFSRSQEVRATLKRVAELGKFVVTGSVCSGLNLLIIFVLTRYLGLHYLLSMTVCFVVVTLVSFRMNRAWTFGKRSGRARVDLVRFVVASTLQLMIALTLCGICVGFLHIRYLVAVAALSGALVPLSYLLHRGWSFRLKWS